MYSCPYGGHHPHPPCGVSLSLNKHIAVKPNFLPLTDYIPPTGKSAIKFESNFTVCISPLFGFSNYQNLVEKIEVSRLFGAEKFILYVHSTSGYRIQNYLSYYIMKNFIKVIPWKLPMMVESNADNLGRLQLIHNMGEAAMVNDCLYRNMLTSRFLVFQDLNEIIVPEFSTQWMDIVTVRKANLFANHSDKESFIIRRRGYNTQCTTAYSNDWKRVSKYMIQSLMTITAEVNARRPFDLSRVILNPRRVIEMGSNYPLRHVNGFGVKIVKANRALVHRYENLGQCPRFGASPLQIYTKDARFRNKFMEEILGRVETIHRYVG